MRDPCHVDVGQRRASVARGQRHEYGQRTSLSRETADRGEYALVLGERATQQRTPRKVDRDLVGERLEGVRSRARYMERIPTVTCSGVDHIAGERARELA